jgi:hypothetical protein
VEGGLVGDRISGGSVHDYSLIGSRHITGTGVDSGIRQGIGACIRGSR